MLPSSLSVSRWTIVGLFALFVLNSLLGIVILPKTKSLRHGDLLCEEARVVRTMMQKDSKGIFTRGGFVVDEGWDTSEKGCYRNRQHYQALQRKGEKYIDEYLQNKPPYLSAPGWNTLLVYPLWRLSQRVASESPDRLFVGLWTLRIVAAFSTACVLSLLCLWVERETGKFQSLVVGLGMLVSSPYILYVLGSHPLYLPFMFFVPFLAIAFAMQSPWRQRTNAGKASRRIAALAGGCVFAKILFGWGYDLLAPVVFSVTVPVVWYAVRERWALKTLLMWLGTLAVAVVVGVVAAFACHAWQAEKIGVNFFAHAQNRAKVRMNLEAPKQDCSSVTATTVVRYYTNKALERVTGTMADKQAVSGTESWFLMHRCASRMQSLLVALLPHSPYLLLLGLLTLWYYRTHTFRHNTLWQEKRTIQATMACLLVGVFVALSQPLTLAEATLTHYFWAPVSWGLVFRPFLFLLLACWLRHTWWKPKEQLLDTQT